MFLVASAVGEWSSPIPEDAMVETVATGFKFTEGPALAPDGSIYFTDIPNNAIHRYDPATGETSRFTDDSGGANGLLFSPGGQGTLFACAGKARVLRYYPAQWEIADQDPPTPGEPMTPTTHGLAWTGLSTQPSEEDEVGHYQDQRLNSPNDLIATEQAIYFTDPRYGNRDGMEMEIEGVYVLTEGQRAEGSEVKIKRVIDDLVRPNGIGLSLDQQTLYVVDNGDAKLFAYPILEPDELGERKLLSDMADLGGGDGMAVDRQGRLYVTIPNAKGVLVLTPEGDRLGFIETGPRTSNCVFGADGKTLYVTADHSLKRIQLDP